MYYTIFVLFAFVTAGNCECNCYCAYLCLKNITSFHLVNLTADYRLMMKNMVDKSNQGDATKLFDLLTDGGVFIVCLFCGGSFRPFLTQLWNLRKGRNSEKKTTIEELQKKIEEQGTKINDLIEQLSRVPDLRDEKINHLDDKLSSVNHLQDERMDQLEIQIARFTNQDGSRQRNQRLAASNILEFVFIDNL